MATRKGGDGQISEMIIERLRQNIHAGVPWRQPETQDEKLGYGDLIFLDSGRHYAIACDFIHEKDDIETITDLWSDLRQDIIDQHIKHKPKSRPWAWWREDREQRRLIRIDKNMLACNEGRIYETEGEYLKRHGLLTSEEKATR
jgi:hypothetical protein